MSHASDPQPAETGISARIDKLTNSIENAISKEVFATVVMPVTSKSTVRKADWAFDWKAEVAAPGRQIFKLTTEDNPTIIQGLISLEEMQGFLYMHLLESAGFNKGRKKLYLGVPGNLVAFACKLAFERGHDGYVAFVSETALLQHYAGRDAHWGPANGYRIPGRSQAGSPVFQGFCISKLTNHEQENRNRTPRG